VCSEPQLRPTRPGTTYGLAPFVAAADAGKGHASNNPMPRSPALIFTPLPV